MGLEKNNLEQEQTERPTLSIGFSEQNFEELINSGEVIAEINNNQALEVGLGEYINANSNAEKKSSGKIARLTSMEITDKEGLFMCKFKLIEN